MALNASNPFSSPSGRLQQFAFGLQLASFCALGYSRPRSIIAYEFIETGQGLTQKLSFNRVRFGVGGKHLGAEVLKIHSVENDGCKQRAEARVQHSALGENKNG